MHPLLTLLKKVYGEPDSIFILVPISLNTSAPSATEFNRLTEVVHFPRLVRSNSHIAPRRGANVKAKTKMTVSTRTIAGPEATLT